MARCIDCNQEFARENLSRRGLCFTCSARRVGESVMQMQTKQGPLYEKFRQKLDERKERRWRSKEKGS